jgi:hypothetical protein
VGHEQDDIRKLTKASHLPHQPGHHLVVLSTAMRIGELVVGIVVVSKVEHDSASLKDTKTAIFQSRNSAIGVDGKEPVLLLSVLGDIDGLYFILEAKLLKNNSWFEAVRSAKCVIG